MKHINHILSVVIIAFSLFGCGSDSEGVDLLKPTADIQLTRDNGIYSPGASILINANFEDETALKECQVTLASLRSLKGWDTDWDIDMYKIPLSGKSFSLMGTRILEDVPADIYYGEYRLSFKVLDESNNYNVYTIDIVIE